MFKKYILISDMISKLQELQTAEINYLQRTRTKMILCLQQCRRQNFLFSKFKNFPSQKSYKNVPQE